MRPPDLPTAAPSYAELFAEGCFAQRSLVSVRTLRKATLDRGVELPPSPRRDCLEPLDRSGGFSPIGFLLTNFTPETVWFNPDPELMVWREERRFQPWDDYGWYLQEGGHIEVSERYSPWQLLYLVDALDEWGGHRALRRIEPQFENPPDVILARRAAAEARLRTLDEEWRSVVKLLVALQPRLWPYRRGRTTLLYEPEGGDAVSPLPRAIETFDSRALLRRFELSLGGLARLHLDLAEAGRRLDPMPRWFRLAEAAPRSVTDELRGDALRARDFYDAAYLLRGLYYLATDRWLPRADEVDDGRTVYEYRRRHLPRRDQPEPFQRIDLKEILVREGLYPHRIHFFVEGHSEKVVLERVLTFLDYELPGSGITVTNIRGVDQAQRQALIFQSASQVAARTVLIADLEGTLSKTLHRLQVEGLFTDNENVLLWSKDGRSVDFEEANFSEREILNAIRTAARRRNHELRFDLTVRELRQERARRTRPRRPPPALTKLALKLAEDQGIRVSKSKELAPVLAEKLISDIRRAGHIAEAGKRRPLLARLWHWLQSER
jgi:hypothetical protein